jgi:hypothetical protein
VKTTPAFKWSLILLIPLTFTWKLLPESPATYEMQGHIVRFLTAHGFNIVEHTFVGTVQIVHAIKGDCSAILAEASLDGSTRDVMQHVDPMMDQHFVVFRGKVYDGQPVWLTATEDSWTRYLRRLRISQPVMPPVMVAESRSCAAEQLPWAELSGPL